MNNAPEVLCNARRLESCRGNQNPTYPSRVDLGVKWGSSGRPPSKFKLWIGRNLTLYVCTHVVYFPVNAPLFPLPSPLLLFCRRRHVQVSMTYIYNGDKITGRLVNNVDPVKKTFDLQSRFMFLLYTTISLVTYTERLFVLINGITILKFNILRLKVREFVILFRKFIWCILI